MSMVFVRQQFAVSTMTDVNLNSCNCALRCLSLETYISSCFSLKLVSRLHLGREFPPSSVGFRNKTRPVQPLTECIVSTHSTGAATSPAIHPASHSKARISIFLQHADKMAEVDRFLSVNPDESIRHPILMHVSSTEQGALSNGRGHMQPPELCVDVPIYGNATYSLLLIDLGWN